MLVRKIQRVERQTFYVLICFFTSALRSYKTVPLYDTDNGPTILEKEYNAVLRGLINDPNIAGPSSFSDTVSWMICVKSFQTFCIPDEEQNI